MTGRALAAGLVLPRPGAGPAGMPARVLGDDAGGIAEIVADASAPADRWVLPAPVNAHDHGRSLATLAFGAVDDVLEIWIAGLGREPTTDPYLRAAVAFARMAESGIAATNHCHNTADPDRLVAEAEAVARAARNVGIRVTFAVPIVDRNPLVYEGADALMATLDPADRAALEAGMKRRPSTATQLDMAREIAALEHPLFKVQHGPVGPQWVRESTLETLAADSAATGRRLHMHLFETLWQRRWADRAHAEGLIGRLDRLGVLSPRLTVAHGIWLDDADAALLAARGVTVAVNTTSNLRLRSGVAPVDRYRRHGLAYALGLDGMAMDDDDDILREARLFWLLHRGFAGDAGVTAAELFAALCVTGRPTLDAPPTEALAAGAPADILVLDAGRMAGDVLPGAADPVTVLTHRMARAFVDRLVVAGRTVVADGKVTGVDLAAMQADLKDRARAGWAAAPPDLARAGRLQAAIDRHYRSLEPVVGEA